MTTESGATGAGADDLDLFEEEATGQTSKKVETIPEKYKGKTVEELIQQNIHAERLIGRQGSELGQMRRMADEILQLKKPAATTQTTEERRPVTVDALLNDPQKAINAAVESSPIAARALAAEQRVAQLEQRITETEFAAKGRNIEHDVNDPAFVEWVNKNPLRQSLAVEAAKHGSPNQQVATRNLWDMWDEYKELVGGSQQQQQQQKKTDVSASRRQTSTSTVRQAPIDSIQQKKPNWSRAKLMELRYKVADGDPAATARWNDPTFQSRMNEAYAEERVK